MSLYPDNIVCSQCDGPMVNSRLSSRCRCNDKQRFSIGETVKVMDKSSFYFGQRAKVQELSQFKTPDHFRIYTVKVGNVTFACDEFNLHPDFERA